MADIETVVDVSTIKEELIFFEEYVPLGYQEEEVVAEPDGEVVVEQTVDNEEVIEATNSILPPQEIDLLDPSQWSHEEVVIDSAGTFIKEEITDTTEVTEQSLVYECYKCAKRFNFKDKLFKHMKLHHARGDDVVVEKDGKRIWTCTLCDKTFISRKGSIIHQRTHTGERPYSCNVCQKRFIDSSTLMKHQVIHQAVRPFSCLVCRRGFNQKVALQRHERTHGQMQPTFKCKYCPKTFLVSSSLQAHEKIHSGIKPYTCQYCSSRFHTSTAQRQHERVHTNERPYQCNYCPKAFKDSGTLFKHQVIHSGIKPFVCPICSQGFTQKVALRKHIRSHVSRNNENICDVCETQFFSKDDLCAHVEEHIEQHPNLSHVRSVASSSLKAKQEMQKVELINAEEVLAQATTATGDLSDLATLCDVAISTAGDLAHSYPCLHCGMTFRRKKSLDAHLSVHRMNCKYCERPFTDKASLDAHEKRLCNFVNPNNGAGIVREDTSSSPTTNNSNASLFGSVPPKVPKRYFYCERCDKTFSSRNGYIIHIRSHTGERPYPCRWCEKAFGDSATRHKHERIHTGERPFKCTRCPRAFNQRAALRAHQITHTVDRAFICKFCPSSFPYFATLKRHQQACHSQLVCPICSQSYNDGKKLQEHLKTKHIGDPNLQCILCDSGVFTDPDEYCDHMIWHSKQHQTGTKLKPPKRRNKRLRTKSPSPQPPELADLELPSKEDEEVIADAAETVYEQVIEEFPIIEGQFSCDVCGILYDDKEQLKLHIPIHF